MTSADPLKTSLKRTEEDINVLQDFTRALDCEKDNLSAESVKMSKDHDEAPANGDSIIKLEEARRNSHH